MLETELAVLSACETGLGEHRHGEGVFGFQRAFMLAGARSLLMSLWNVDDAATQELMTQFYEGLLEDKDRSEALRDAQLWLREQGYHHPRFWAAFILVGDAGPLPKTNTFEA